MSRRRLLARPGERGSISVFVVVFSVVVFLLAGMLVDGGAAINARLRAADVAEQAARAGADMIDVAHLRETGEAVLLSRDEVCGRAEEIMSAHGDDAMSMPECDLPEPALVTVSVVVRWDAYFLAAIGFPGADMTGSATAGPDLGDLPEAPPEEDDELEPVEPSLAPTMPVSGQ